MNVENKFYDTLKKFKTSVIKLGFKSAKEYRLGYKQDNKLPKEPGRVYEAEWVSWQSLFGKNKIYYPTLKMAQKAAKKLGLKTAIHYRKSYKIDPSLHSRPNQFYKNEWQSWPVFLGTKVEFYATLEEASQAAKSYGFKILKHYSEGYKIDSRLPARPNTIYKTSWKSWPDFLGNGNRFYATLDEATIAARNLECRTIKEYTKCYKQDSKLPSYPNLLYKKDWISWLLFLGNERIFYSTYTEAESAVRKLTFKTIEEYDLGYKQDPCLPSKPSIIYKDDWVSFPNFLGKEVKFYLTLEEARLATKALGFLTRMEYLQGYSQDPKLPSDPHRIYKNDWESWMLFLLPKKITSLFMLKLACKTLATKNSTQYKKHQKKYPQIPSKPERKFQEEWISWYDLLDLPVPYPYEEASSIALQYGATNIREYQLLVNRLNDPKLPKTPDKVYVSVWKHWYAFLCTDAPFQPAYISEGYSEWKKFIDEFMIFSKGGGTKKQHICKFLRLYIEKYDLGNSPIDFLIRGEINVNPFLKLLKNEKISLKKTWIKAVNEFLNWVVDEKLTIEDEDTGQLVLIENAFNPFKTLNFNNEYHSVVRNETNKPELPYAYTKSGREWIFQNSVASYSELQHLQRFNGDWVELFDTSIIDSNDPDCVIKFDNDKTYIWNPIYWTYTYALMQLPARGRQIVYSDSGEADEVIPVISNNKVVWVDNTSQLSGQTNRQGMVCQFEDGEYGVYYTSNKTHMAGKGYKIPYMPHELAYWLIKLRDWQKKYNKISSPTPWELCERTNLNLIQRRQKGSNSFLFRDFNEIEPGTFGHRLAQRLACALFFSGPDDLSLAQYDGQDRKDLLAKLDNHVFSISKFKSEFTPHSMRVSLINTFVVEFGLPIEDVMKLVGHSSIVMTIYYLKTNQGRLRVRMEKGEKKALKDQANASQRLIEAQRIEELKSNLIATDSDFCASLNNDRHPAGYLFKDFGFCAVGGSRCEDGGDYVGGKRKTNLRLPVSPGYLGSQNCVRCRFFVTGVAFMGGMVALANEISLQIRAESGQYQDLCVEIDSLDGKLNDLDDEIYQCNNQGQPIEDIQHRKNILNQQLRKTQSEMETVAKRIDMYGTDIQYCTRHLNLCKNLIKEDIKSNEESGVQMIIQPDSELEVECEETSYFRQLCEVCENTEMYQACNGKLAITPRSQLLDRLAMNNGMQPKLFTLNEKTQLAVGNQMVEIFMARLKSWDKIDDLIEGRINLDELDTTEKVTRTELENLFKPKRLIGPESV